MANGKPPTGDDIVELAARHIGQTYKLGSLVPMNDPNYSGPWDCSEFCSWLVYQLTGTLFGCTEGSRNPATAKAFTGYWRDDALRLDAEAKKQNAPSPVISIEQARRIPGAFILRVPTTIGHVVVSDGTGGTVEAMGAAFGVRRGRVDGRVWNFGILPPGIDYGDVQSHKDDQEPPPSETVLVLRRNEAITPDPRVEALQRALNAAGFDPGPFDGLFGPLTERAVFDFQDSKGLFVDGEVGPQTGRALKLDYWPPAVALPPFEQPAPPQPLPPPLAADWPRETRAVNPSIRLADIGGEYLALWNTMALRPERTADVAALADRIAKGRDRYLKAVANFPNLPWYVVGLLHAMECGCDFRAHLHNGDPLSARTVHVPRNRPPVWDPSWDWSVSAADAIAVDGLDKVTSWSLPQILFTLERYNGMGPRHRFGRATAYLWSFANHYVRGKYVGDGQWDPEATSKQAGAAVLLRQLAASGAIPPM